MRYQFDCVLGCSDYVFLYRQTPVNAIATLVFIMYAKELQMIFAFINPSQVAI